MQGLSVLILAAGKGKRMRSDLPKVLHPLAGRPILSYVIETARRLKPRSMTVVIGHAAAQVKKEFHNARVQWVLQGRQRGTADAVLAAFKSRHRPTSRRPTGPLLILYGDVPLLTEPLLKRMQETFDRERPALAMLTAIVQDPTGYGRIVRNGTGEIARIVEERDADLEHKKIREINPGIYLVQAEEIFEPLKEIERNAAAGEFYLTDLVEKLLRRGKKVVTITAPDAQECLGINSRIDLARAERTLRLQRVQGWMERAVDFRDPDTVWIGPEVRIAPGAIIQTGVVIDGKSWIESGAEILPYTVIEESRVGKGARVGPFAHLRPGSIVGDGAHVGNFVELKKTVLKKGAKANHLAYLGDAVVGEGTNVGAGMITCNYDGFRKHRTTIGRNVFIGSDVQLVAPVRLADGSWVGAGTTVTKNVPSGALALSRTEQKNIKGWVNRRKKGKG